MVLSCPSLAALVLVPGPAPPPSSRVEARPHRPTLRPVRHSISPRPTALFPRPRPSSHTQPATSQTGLSGDIRTSIYICVALAGLVVVGIVIMCLHMAIIRARARNDGYRHVASA